jgi:hypothetical protein
MMPAGLSGHAQRDPMDRDEQAIRDLVAAWMSASAAGDHERVLGLMADDVVFLVPGRPPIRGKAAFAAAQAALEPLAPPQIIGDHPHDHRWRPRGRCVQRPPSPRLMRHFIDIAIFSTIVLVAICLLARYSDSWLGRIVFTRLGPVPLRRELRSRYFLRWAAYAAGWFAQAVFAFALGWAAWRLVPTLAESLPFLVLWLVVVPLLAIVSLAGSAVAVVAFLWRRLVGAERAAGRASDAVKA